MGDIKKSEVLIISVDDLHDSVPLIHPADTDGIAGIYHKAEHQSPLTLKLPLTNCAGQSQPSF